MRELVVKILLLFRRVLPLELMKFVNDALQVVLLLHF
ncbi:PTS mannose transporter subunit IIA [Listeria monocytogenes]|nr:PTS mannose transporter subunit IIA [Listeria monocytogenes]